MTLTVDDEPVDSTQRWLYHKTSNRETYARRARRHPGTDDVVLVNELGEVTETTIANLAVQLDGGWYTPPVSAGCIPGIERNYLVELGLLRERARLSGGALEIDSRRGVGTVLTLRLPRPIVTALPAVLPIRPPEVSGTSLRRVTDRAMRG